MNTANWHKRNTRLDTTGWERWSTGNCSRDWNSIILTNRRWTIQNLGPKNWHKCSGIFFYINRSPHTGQEFSLFCFFRGISIIMGYLIPKPTLVNNSCDTIWPRVRIQVSEFVLQSSYYVNFRANTLGKGMNPLILPAMQRSSRCILQPPADWAKTFFVWALLLIVHKWNSSPLRSNLLRLQSTCSTVPTTSARPHGSPPVSGVNDLRHSLFHLLNSLITTASEL